MATHILLVDDDPLLREVVEEYLTSNGFIVDTAESAEQALAMFSPGKYQGALIDIVLPGMNGLDLMKEIQDRDEHVFCLVMTGYPTIDQAYKAMVHGSSDYIIKPFHLPELLHIIRNNV